jgi:DNA-binding NtrC family response regulator
MSIPATPPTDAPAGRVLFVDDDPDVLKAGALLLRRHGFEVATISRPEEIWAALAEAPVDSILLDLNFRPGARSGEEGLEVLRRIVALDPDAVVSVVTGHSGVGVAVSAMRAGADDFIMKPWSNDRLVAAVTDAVALRWRRRERGGALSAATSDTLIIGASPAVDRLRAHVARLAATESPVLIVGEAGAGKALAAQALHAASSRRDQPFLSLDLAALSPEAQVAGVRSVTGGVLLLKSVEALVAEAFGALSTMVETTSPVRILAATARAETISHWPDSLRFGLAGLRLQVPALRARRGDIPELTHHFIRRAAAVANRLPRPVSPEAEVWLTGADWPGNVRELRAVVEQAMLLGEGDVLGLSDLKPFDEPVASLRAIEPGDDLNLDRQERRLVEAALKRHGFNVSHAARDLGLTRAALYRRMEKHAL